MRRFVETILFAVVLGAAVVRADPVGLVLSGGGAKGAYEVGVWQVLEETGIASNITAISGTSVGAINAALFATRPDAAETLWLDCLPDIFIVSTNRMRKSSARPHQFLNCRGTKRNK